MRREGDNLIGILIINQGLSLKLSDPDGFLESKGQFQLFSACSFFFFDACLKMDSLLTVAFE